MSSHRRNYIGEEAAYEDEGDVSTPIEEYSRKNKVNQSILEYELHQPGTIS